MPEDFTVIRVGTGGDDYVEEVGSGEAYCGLGGDDVVQSNRGTFLGGGGGDGIEVNEAFGRFDGGGGRDFAFINKDNAEFFGGPGSDEVDYNQDSATFFGCDGKDSIRELVSGSFFGGGGKDTVEVFHSGLFDGLDDKDTVVVYIGGTCVNERRVAPNSPAGRRLAIRGVGSHCSRNVLAGLRRLRSVDVVTKCTMPSAKGRKSEPVERNRNARAIQRRMYVRPSHEDVWRSRAHR